MLFGIGLFSDAEVISIPQHDKENAAKRAREIQENQEEYQWSFDTIGATPMVAGVPREENPPIGWISGIANTIFRVLANNLAVKYANSKDDVREQTGKLLYRVGSITASVLQKITLGRLDSKAAANLLDDVSELFEAAFETEGKGVSFEEYKDLFKVFKPDAVAAQDQFLGDDIFGWYRVAGPDPMHIQKLTGDVSEMFPELTDDIFQGVKGFNNDSLKEAQQENRLFYLDFKEFEGLPTGKLPDGTLKEGFHVYAPTSLLAVPKETDDRTTVLPIAIRCGQGNDYPMYTANSAHTDGITWLAAKCTVQVADAVMLEARYHLGRTHLLLEAFICSIHRTLAPTHPLLKLLAVHFEGTHFINYLGSLRLAAPGGTIDVITAPQIETTTSLCIDAIRPPFKFNEWMPDKEFEARGVLDADRLKYPFRDDALKIWKAINDWVHAYVTAYYKSDADVVGDHELANWCREIVDPNMGALPGFGETADGEIKTIKYLVRFVSTLIYIGSVQHAALNFPQGAFMQFVPAMPMAGFSPAPTTAKPFKSIDHWVEEMLPDLTVAQRQLNTAELLAGFQWTCLGEYGRYICYAPDEVQDALKIFKEELSIIGADIQKRNTVERLVGLPVYDFLVPKNIPQSTNV
ncbi:unnamed protein product [Agarophyton chilense]